MEIERRFLVPRLTNIENAPMETIRQGYLAIDKDTKSSVRIRQAGDKYTLTAKAGIPGLGMIARHEGEISLTAEEFKKLWPLTQGRLEKQRYRIPLQSLVVELDRFLGLLDGLNIAEVEFVTIQDADAFEPPAWFGREVTQEPAFTNAAIARSGNPLHLEGPA